MFDMNVNILQGLTLIDIKINEEKTEIRFFEQSGREFLMFHQQECCESVSIEDIVGDLKDLIGTPILLAEKTSSSNNDNIPGKIHEYDYGDGSKIDRWADESYTWTFYKFRTIKGSVDIRWYGSSNGHYSEAVDFIEIFYNNF